MPRPLIRWWQWPTILSLDAPLVALLWQWQFARAAGVALGAAPRFVLGASVWLSYVGDRWFEGWRLAPEAIQTPRHLLYQRWRWPICAFSCLVIAADLEAAFRHLSPRDLHAGFWLLGPVLAYILSHQWIHRGHLWRMPKEVCVALLFGAGASLFVISPDLRALPRIALPLGLFTVLCFANCALISVWEREVDRSHGQTSFSRQFRGGSDFSRALPWVLAVAAALAWRAAEGHARSAVICAGASSILLGLVDRLEQRLGRQAARVLADLVLLTPAAVLLLSPVSVAPDFDRLARIYRPLEFAAFGRSLERARFRFLGRLAGAREILVLGEGDGRCLARLAPAAPQARIRCIDASAAMLARASSRLGPEEARRVSFERADVFAADFPPARYDAVVTLFFLDCFPAGQVELLAERIRTSLRPGGLWLWADFRVPESGWPRWRSRVSLALLYAFFRWRTGLAARDLPPAEEILARNGLACDAQEDFQFGFVRSAVWRRIQPDSGA